VVVVDVLRQDPQQMPFADHHDMVKTFPSNRSFHTATCCRSARFSSANSRCVQTVLLSVPRTIPSHLTMIGQIADRRLSATLNLRVGPSAYSSMRRTGTGTARRNGYTGSRDRAHRVVGRTHVLPLRTSS